MAPSYSTLNGANRRNTAEISRLLAFSMNKPAIPMVNPKKGKTKGQTTLSKDDIRNVTHEIHYTRNSDDKYTQVMAKLTDDSGPEEYCIWRQEIRNLFMAKESLGSVPFDYKQKLILSSMAQGERSRFFTAKSDNYLEEETRKLGYEAAQEAAAAALEMTSIDKKKKKDTPQDKESNAEDSPKKKKKKDKKKEAEGEIPRKAKSNKVPKSFDVPIWRALNDLGLQIFPQGAQAYRIQKDYLTNCLALSMNNQQPEKWARRFIVVADYFHFFPLAQDNWSSAKRHPRLLDEDEKVAIFLQAAKWEYQPIIKMDSTFTNCATLKEAVKLLSKVDEGAQLQQQLEELIPTNKRQHGSDNGQSRKQHKGNHHSKQNSQKGAKNNNSNKKCGNCGKPGHADEECWYDEANAHKAPWNKSKGGFNKHKSSGDDNKTVRFKSKRKREETNWMEARGISALLKKVYEHGKETGQSSQSKASAKSKGCNKDQYDVDSESDDSFGSTHHINNEPARSDKSSNKRVLVTTC